MQYNVLDKSSVGCYLSTYQCLKSSQHTCTASFDYKCLCRLLGGTLGFSLCCWLLPQKVKTPNDGMMASFKVIHRPYCHLETRGELTLLRAADCAARF